MRSDLGIGERPLLKCQLLAKLGGLKPAFS